MKRRICSIVLLLAMLAGISVGCSVTGNSSDTESAGQTNAGTSNKTDNGTEEVTVSALSVSEQAYYFTESVDYEIYEDKDDEDPERVSGFRYMCYDPETDSVFALCGIDGCSHNTRSCNAYYDVNDDEDKYLGVVSLQYEDGYLYQLGYSYSEKALYLYRIAVDGTSELEAYRKLAEVDFVTGSGDYNFSFPGYCIIDGYVYYDDSYLKNSDTPQKLYRMELESGDAEELFEADSEVPGIWNFYECGQYLYFQQREKLGESTKTTQGYTYRYDTESGTVECIMNASPNCYAVNDDYVYYIEDKNLYSCSTEEQSVTLIAENIAGDTETVSMLYLIEDAVIVSLNAADDSGILAAYDTAGNLLERMECDPDESFCVAVGKNYIYGTRFRSEEVLGEANMHTSIMKTEDFLQGNGAWIDIT